MLCMGECIIIWQKLAHRWQSCLQLLNCVQEVNQFGRNVRERLENLPRDSVLFLVLSLEAEYRRAIRKTTSIAFPILCKLGK